MKRRKTSSEQGQSLVLLTLMVVALIGMMAVVVDGGFGFTQRRRAQTAADAGALAGARDLCENNGVTAAITRARDYAVTRNGASRADIAINDGIVTVNTFIDYDTFFASVLGRPQMTVAATAQAGCTTPTSGTGVMPIAWACRPPVGVVGTEDCAVEFGTIDTPGPTYIIMDTEKLANDLFCQNPPNSGKPAGTLDCDLNNDGIDEVLAGGGRSWMDLNGGGIGANDLMDWITGGYPGELSVHTWFAEQTGAKTSAFQAAKTQVGNIVIMPVFDSYCVGNPQSACPAAYHGEDQVVSVSSSSPVYFHVISFSVFKVTCVFDGNGVKGNKYPCPGRQLAQTTNPSIPKNMKSIEGYFIEGYVPGLTGNGGGINGGGGIDAGAYTINVLR